MPPSAGIDADVEIAHLRRERDPFAVRRPVRLRRIRRAGGVEILHRAAARRNFRQHAAARSFSSRNKSIGRPATSTARNPPRRVVSCFKFVPSALHTQTFGLPDLAQNHRHLRAVRRNRRAGVQAGITRDHAPLAARQAVIKNIRIAARVARVINRHPARHPRRLGHNRVVLRDRLRVEAVKIRDVNFARAAAGGCDLNAIFVWPMPLLLVIASTMSSANACACRRRLAPL